MCCHFAMCQPNAAAAPVTADWERNSKPSISVSIVKNPRHAGVPFFSVSNSVKSLGLLQRLVFAHRLDSCLGAFVVALEQRDVKLARKRFGFGVVKCLAQAVKNGSLVFADAHPISSTR